MDCNNSLSLALQMGSLMMALIFGLVGIMIALIKLSQKK